MHYIFQESVGVSERKSMKYQHKKELQDVSAVFKMTSNPKWFANITNGWEDYCADEERCYDLFMHFENPNYVGTSSPGFYVCESQEDANQLREGWIAIREKKKELGIPLDTN